MEGTPIMTVIQSVSMRDLVNQANQQGVQKENIVSIMQDARTDEFMLIYYR